MMELAVLCANMDKDGDGAVGLSELSNAYDNLPQLRTLMDHMDIQKDEMEQVFHEDGSLSYLEFCQKLGGFFKNDPSMMQSIMQMSIKELKRTISHDVESWQQHGHAGVQDRQVAGLGT